MIHFSTCSLSLYICKIDKHTCIFRNILNKFKKIEKGTKQTDYFNLPIYNYMKNNLFTPKLTIYKKVFSIYVVYKCILKNSPGLIPYIHD